MSLAFRIFYNWLTSHLNIFHNWLDGLIFYIIANEISYWIAWFGVKIFRRITGNTDAALNSKIHWALRVLIYSLIALVT